MGFTDLFEPSHLLTYFLIIMRMGGLFFTAPVFSSSSLLNPVRMILVLIISLLTITDPNILWLIVSVAKEILIGICIGGMTSLLFSGLQLGGYLVDYQIGFSMVSVIDPSTNSNVSFTGQIYNILGTLIYLGIYGHHIFLMFILTTFIKIFVIAIQITAPVFIALMITNVIMGILARLVPQMNIMVIGFPVKITIGVLMLIASMQLFYIAYEKIVFEYFRQIQKFFEINSILN